MGGQWSLDDRLCKTWGLINESKILYWDREAEPRERELPAEIRDAYVRGCAFSPTGNLAVTVSDRTGWHVIVLDERLHVIARLGVDRLYNHWTADGTALLSQSLPFSQSLTLLKRDGTTTSDILSGQAAPVAVIAAP